MELSMKRIMKLLELCFNSRLHKQSKLKKENGLFNIIVLFPFLATIFKPVYLALQPSYY